MSLIWRVPTYYGDIAVENTGPKTCKVVVVDATPEERRALDVLAKHAARKKWVSEGTVFGANTLVNAPTDAVAKVIAGALKPSRALIHAVKFAQGKIEEVHAATFKTDGEAAKSAAAKPVAATSVPQPTRGCPPPDFSPARLRARTALFEFLTPEQREDYERHNRFVVEGATTGHRYMLTSRTNRDALATYQRTLFDLDEGRPYCVHDWDVPPEEELLALAVHIQLPGYEAYCRHLDTV